MGLLELDYMKAKSIAHAFIFVYIHVSTVID